MDKITTVIGNGYQQPPEFTRDFFKDSEGLFFIDIGANDGETWSNTLFLEKSLNWKGICIEPHPTMFKKLITTRCVECINVAVSDKEGIADFLCIEGSWEANMLSGLVDKYGQQHKERVDKEYVRFGGVSTNIQVPTIPLQSILDVRNISKVDYLSIDTEGAELSILQSLDFSKVDITLISVETNYGGDEFDKILNSYGYNFVTKVACDSFYTKKIYD